MTDPAWRHRAIVAAFLALSSGGGQANADCAFEPQGEGRVAAVVYGRSFRLDDGREVRLAGIEPAIPDKAKAAAALSAIVMGREVTLHGEDDAPDRYGRQPAFAFLAGSETPVQSELLRRGEALVSTEVIDKDCAAGLVAAEAEARRAKYGTWADPAAIKTRKVPAIFWPGLGVLRWSRARFCPYGRQGP